MKKLFLIIITVLSFSCKAQEYPLNTNPSEIPNNAYLKDMNNELDKYVGLWKGTWNGKILYIGKSAALDITNFTGNQMTLHFEYMPSIYKERLYS